MVGVVGSGEALCDALHVKLLSLAKSRARSDFELGVALVAADDARVHEHLGYGSFTEYVELLFGLTPRQTTERLRVARALSELPLLRDALAEGARPWSVARELSRVATAETEEEWFEHTKHCSARHVEQMVAGRKPGDRRVDPRKVEAERHRIVLEVSAPTWALWQELRRVVTATLGGHVNDDALVAAIARCALEGEREVGESSYRISVSRCPDCGATRQRAGGDSVVIDEADFETACCDAQHVGNVDGVAPARASQSVPPAVRRMVVERHGGTCAVPGCRHAAFVDLHHVERRADGGTHDPERLVCLCEAHHRAVHRGALVVRGTFSSGFTFEHADGTRYGMAVPSAARATVFATVLSLLVSMGFKQREAQRLVDRVRATHVGDDASVEQVLHAALRLAPIPGGMSRVREEHAVYAARSALSFACG